MAKTAKNLNSSCNTYENLANLARGRGYVTGEAVL
jgi:hypothetical protein